MANNDLILLGNRISELRKSQGLSQEDLSEMCDMSSRHISEIERGKTNPTFEVLSKIGKALGKDITALMDFRHHSDVEDLRDEMIDIIQRLGGKKLKAAYRLLRAIDA